jgi:hypothetical protein
MKPSTIASTSFTPILTLQYWISFFTSEVCTSSYAGWSQKHSYISCYTQVTCIYRAFPLYEPGNDQPENMSTWKPYCNPPTGTCKVYLRCDCSGGVSDTCGIWNVCHMTWPCKSSSCGQKVRLFSWMSCGSNQCHIHIVLSSFYTCLKLNCLQGLSLCQ